jgi:hypothetical protein
MEQSRSCVADRFATSQEIPHILWTQRLITAFKSNGICLYPEPVQSSPYPHIALNEVLF